jgi:hypothetical protein
MNLKTYDNSLKRQHHNKPYLTVSKHHGSFSINHPLLSPGDQILFQTNLDRPSDWYIRKTADKEMGFELRANNSKSLSTIFRCTRLAAIFLKDNGLKEKSYTMQLGEPFKDQREILIPIITKSAKPNTKI